MKELTEKENLIGENNQSFLKTRKMFISTNSTFYSERSNILTIQSKNKDLIKRIITEIESVKYYNDLEKLKPIINNYMSYSENELINPDLIQKLRNELSIKREELIINDIKKKVNINEKYLNSLFEEIKFYNWDISKELIESIRRSLK